MTENPPYNDHFRPDPANLIAALLATALLAKTLTAQEANTFATLLTALLTALPYVRR